MILIHFLSILASVTSHTEDQSLYVKLGNVFESICLSQIERTDVASRQAPSGKMAPIEEKGGAGIKGSKGEPGEADYDKVEEMISKRMQEVLDFQARKHSNLSNMLSEANEKIGQLENETSLISLSVENGPEYRMVGSITNPAVSCKEVKRDKVDVNDGLYYIMDLEGNIFQTYCDMNTAGGGWTLIASIHENNMKGKCTAGDRWSSEQGNSAAHPHGDGFWENRATHGDATSAASDDYKNSGYFAMNASDIMIWQVPNDTPIERFTTRAFQKFHTTSGFLRSYGGNLGSLYSIHFNMRAKQFRTSVDNGPAIPIVWDVGSNEDLLRLLDSNIRKEVDAGFVQFRAINTERNAFALCPGVKIKPGKANVEHACIGSTSNNIGHTNEEHYCGDFSGRDWAHSAGWKSDQKLIDSVLMIFYK